MDKNSILVVDDEFDIVNIIRIALSREGYDVFGFTDPLMALEHFNTNHMNYGLVILDLRIPAMSGFDFVMNIREIKPAPKVLLMSAFATEDDSEISQMFNSHDIVGFLQKPFSLKQLINTVKSYM